MSVTSSPGTAVNRILSECALPMSATELCDALVDMASHSFRCRTSIWLRERLTGSHRPFDSGAVKRFENCELPTQFIVENSKSGAIPAREVQAAVRPRDRARKTQVELALGGTALLAMRGSSCVGLLVIEGPLDEDDGAAMTVGHAFCDAITVAYDREFVHNLLRAPQMDLDFRGSPAEFYKGLAGHVADAARMQFVAIREYDEASESLATLAVHGLSEGSGLRRYDLRPVSRFPSFQAALDGQTPIPSSATGPELEALHEIEELRDVRSFVVTPLHTEGGAIGVLSGATKHAYDYSGNEILGFTNLGQNVAMSMSYFRSAQTQREQLMELAETAAAFTGIEVAAAVRHEAKLQVTNVTSRLGIARDALKQRKYAVGLERVEKAKEDTNLLFNTLDQLRLVTIPPNRTSTLIGLKTLIEGAVNTASANIRQRGLGHPLVDGPDTKVLVYEDWIRQVIVNLLLNSLDAYGNRRGSHAAKGISIRIESTAAKSSVVKFQYSDEAGGLQPHRLNRPDDEPIVDAEAAIFEKGVTSKKTGTGYGLWLARSIMTEHGGSIDLLDHRGGMTFSLALPVPDQSPLPQPKEK